MTDKTYRAAARYLGAKTAEKALSMRPLLESLTPALMEAVAPRSLVKRWPVSVAGGQFVLGGLPPLESRDLCRLFAGAREGLVVAITLGADTDALIRRELVRDPARGAALGALASAFVEEALDELMQTELINCRAAGQTLSPRFSPGYGDAPLSYQRPLTEGLETWRIGVRLTEGCLMVPEKSVTALCAVREGTGERGGSEGQPPLRLQSYRPASPGGRGVCALAQTIPASIVEKLAPEREFFDTLTCACGRCPVTDCPYREELE